MKILVSISLFVLLILDLSGQDKAQLEKERNLLLQKIEQTSKVLVETEETKKSTLSDLKLINNQISNRQKLIRNIQQDVQKANQVLSHLNQSISYLDSVTIKMKQQYGQLINAAYRNKLLQNKWLQLLNASSINDAFVRWRYIQQFENYTKARLQDLSIKQDELLLQKQELNAVKVSKNNLLVTEKAQSQELLSEKNLKNKLLKGISKTEQQLKRALNYQKKQSTELSATIERIIQSEISKSLENVAISHKSGASFVNYKKELLWPLNSARIDSKFGKQAHPKLKSVFISNNGIDISSPEDQEVKVIFEGIVVGTTAIPGFDFMIVVQHGEFYSVYSKVDQVLVNKGDTLKKNQVIGIPSKDENGRSLLHFELWQNKTKLNPEYWLK